MIEVVTKSGTTQFHGSAFAARYFPRPFGKGCLPVVNPRVSDISVQILENAWFAQVNSERGW